jgi:acyl carrier protein
MTEMLAVPSRDSVIAKLNAALLKIPDREPGPDALTDSTRLREDLGLDSYAALELLFELEDTLGLRIPQRAAMSFNTVGDVVSYVLDQRSAEQPPRVATGGTGTP